MPALLSFAAYAFTLMDHAGPGVAAAWPAVVLGAGEPADAVLAPLYKLLLFLLGLVPSSWVMPHLLIGWLIALLMAGASGFFALLLHRWLSSIASWGAASLAAFGGALAGTAALTWTAALTPNPAPLSLLLLLAGGWMLACRKTQRDALLAALLAGLAVSAHLAAAVALPLFIWPLRGRFRVNPIASALAFALPLTLFLLPRLPVVFDSHGLLSQPPNVPPGLSGLSLFAWSLWQAWTPVVLLIAAIGIAGLLRTHRSALVATLAALAWLTAASLLPFAAEWAAIAAGFTLAALVATGLAVLFNRLPRGLAMLLWLLLPLIWLTRGPELSRHGEDLWEAHALNVLTSQRYETMVVTTDHEALLAPVLYLQRAQHRRQDVLFVDPRLLTREAYVESFDLENLLESNDARTALDQLRDAFDRNDEAAVGRASNRFFFAWVNDALVTMDAGVLVSSELDLGPQIELIPEGLLWRVWNGKTYPFLFEALDLGPIYPRDDPRSLVHDTIELYPDMFAYRAAYLIEDQLTTRAADYVRWALRVDPQHAHARRLADDYNIHGDPLLLEPRNGPREKHWLPGVR